MKVFEFFAGCAYFRKKAFSELGEGKMKKHLVSINDLPPDGKEFALDDQDIWLEPIREFKMDCRIVEPIKGKVFVQPQDEGALVRGNLMGVIVVPCNRCAEDATVKIDAEFSEYEEIPEKTGHSQDEDHESHIVYDRYAPMLDLATVGWEQFMLAQPSMPLCREDCKGLCPQCGMNLNVAECDCPKNAPDSRMAALADVKVKKD